MNLGTEENPVKVILDTNILISASGFRGKPREVLLLVLQKRIAGVTSPVLLAEFQEVVSKKFPKLAPKLPRITKKLQKNFAVVQPGISINASRDKDDNRVIEAAVEGNCDYIITGDKDLLDLKKYQNVKILRAEEFLREAEFF